MPQLSPRVLWLVCLAFITCACTYARACLGVRGLPTGACSLSILWGLGINLRQPAWATNALIFEATPTLHACILEQRNKKK